MDEEEEVSRPNICSKFVVASSSAVVLGVAIGLLLKFYCTLSEDHLEYIAFPGGLLLQLLQSMTVPMIVSSVVIGVLGLSKKKITSKVTIQTMTYFAITTLLAVMTGFVLVMLLEPGIAYTKEKTDPQEEETSSLIGALVELLFNLFPSNPLRACFQQYKLEVIEVEIPGNGLDSTNDTDVQVVGYYVDGVNILGLIVWSFFLGLGLVRMGEEEGIVAQHLIVLNMVAKQCFSWIRLYLPVGILFLIITHVIEEHDWDSPFKLAKFMGVVLFGLVIHGGIILPMLFMLCTRQNPFYVIKGVTPALVTALLISSSSATLPQTFQCCEENLGVSRRISRFMLPILTTINMNGTALYEVAAAIFIAQLNHLHLSLGQVITILVTAALSSIGAAGIPATGAMTTMLVLKAAGLPAKEAAILVAIEWVLDRFNTVVNVYGDCVGVALVHCLSGNNLAPNEGQAELETDEDEDEAGELELEEVQVDVSSFSSRDDTYFTASEDRKESDEDLPDLF